MNDLGSRLSILGVVIAALVLGSFQGGRIQDMRQTEAFYRWVITASSAVRLGDTLEPDKASDIAEPQDEELFADFLALADPLFKDLPVDPEQDLDMDGNEHGPLLRAVRQEEDARLYAIASSPEAADMRTRFMDYSRAGKLQMIGSQFQAAALYQSDQGAGAQGVGLTSLFFGFRKLAANFLWLQVDKYWHRGEVHRLLPLLKTCVAMDPQFVDAYLVGSWHLAYNLTAKLENTPEPEKNFVPKWGARVGPKERWYYVSADFLKDGIRKNPRDYRLYFDLGYAIYEDKMNDHENAVRYLTEARRHAHDKWVPRMLFRSMWLNGQYEDAIKGWEGYLEDYPDNEPGLRFIEINRGYLAEARHEQAIICAFRAREAAEIARIEGRDEDAQQAEEAAASMDQLAEVELAKANEIFGLLANRDGDPIAQARLSRQKAMNYVAAGRVVEALPELEMARFQISDFFFEASNMIIEMKNMIGYSLTVSERQQVLRDEDAEQYIEKKPRRMHIECDYLDPMDDITILQVMYAQSQNG